MTLQNKTEGVCKVSEERLVLPRGTTYAKLGNYQTVELEGVLIEIVPGFEVVVPADFEILEN